MNYLVKIWRDPVWSKVIAAGIITLAVTLWSVFNNIGESIETILVFPVKLYIILTIAAIVIIGYVGYRRFIGRSLTQTEILTSRIGAFSFKDLYELMENRFVGERNKQSLNQHFQDYDSNLIHGVYDYYNDEFLEHDLAPLLKKYGLAERIVEKSGREDYYVWRTTDEGIRYLQLLELYTKRKLMSSSESEA